ncbi:MAG: ABC transporter substrate-binding protein [Bacteroidales bacterium]|nr:ABC transporter substrate-binding protein [Bacteroidales bacterium]MBN2633330.1 ABC transporter substrate-binding protein [Bacteroidales bacterium]
MRINESIKVFTIICFLLPAIASSCGNRGGGNAHKTGRRLTDAAGRSVSIPDTLTSVVAIRPGTLRLLSYMGVTDRVAYIEGNEKIRNIPYLMANPDLRDLEIIGTGNNYDTELLASCDAELIISTFMNTAEADRLGKITGKPVFLLEYGNLGNRMEDLFKSLRLLGEIFYCQPRADTIIGYINHTITELKSVSSASKKEDISVYIGGVAYSGSHGITSTVPGYPPFNFLSLNNSASAVESMMKSSGITQDNAFIEKEQLITWDPDYLFLDASGISIWQNEIDDPAFRNTMRALKEGYIYIVLPYNWYTVNYENLLCNSWFIAGILFPDIFSETDLEHKYREIYKFFLGTDIFDEIVKLYNPFIRYKFPEKR